MPRRDHAATYPRTTLKIALLGAALALASSLAVADQRQISNLRSTVPPGWERSVNATSHLTSFAPAGGHASATFMAGADFTGTAEDWHDQLWRGLAEGMKIRPPPPANQSRGEFIKSWAAFDKADGTQIWICLYTAVKSGRGEGVVFFADAETPFVANLTLTDRMIDGTTFAQPQDAAASVTGPNAPEPGETSTSPAATSKPLPAKEPAVEAAAAAPADLAINLPPGWTRQQDPTSKVLYLKPPDAPAIKNAAIIVFPALDYPGTPEEFQSDNLSRALRGCRLIEPVRKRESGGFLIADAHYLSAQGAELRMVLYTARWGTRAQVLFFAADRDALFRAYAPIAERAVMEIAVPGKADAAASAALAPAASAAVATSPAAEAVEFMPVLDYADPPNFFRGAMRNFADYSSTEVNYSLCVYPFKAFSGDIKAAFRQTLLRDWLDIQYREENVAGPPQFGTNSMPGADAVLDAHFHENIVGLLNERHRVLIIAGNMAAIVDMKAPNLTCWQKALPSALEMLKAMRVGKKPAPPSLGNGPGAQGAALAGLFMGTKAKFMALGVVDYTSHVQALHYFLFSADGHVFRCYDFPPGGSENAAQRFDFDAAARQDPGNTGRFAVRGNELYIKMGGPNADELKTSIDDPNTLQLDSVRYVRKQ